MRGHIEQLGPDRFKIRLFAGSVNGKKKYRIHVFRGTRRGAQREAARLIAQITEDRYIEPNRMTLAAHLRKWLETTQTRIGAKTYERYTEIVEKHLIPNLGHVALSKLGPATIQSYYAGALKQGRRDGKGGLSAQTIHHHHRVLHRALRMAVKWQLVARNPATDLDLPRPERREMQIVDEAETMRLIEAARSDRLYPVIVLALMTGMRRGEILALRWQDVELETGTLAIRRSLEQTKAGIAFKEPKTRKARVVVLPRIAVEMLRRHRAEQAKVRLIVGSGYEDNDLICAQPNGSPWPPSWMSQAAHHLLQRCGLKDVRLHDLRHAHASLLLKEGVHPKVVSERLGHSDVGITLNRYSHLLPNLQEDAAQKIDAALRAAKT